MKKFLKWTAYVLLSFILIIVLFGIYAYQRIQMDEPIIKDRSVFNLKRTDVNDSIKTCDGDWLKHDKSGLYEMRISGSPIELGVKNGILAKELIAYQEEAFVEEIKKMIPSEFYLNFLKYFIGWFNRDMDDYVPLANQQEIYGVSQFTDDKYDFIAPKYQRILNYHGAHDIGHALQNMNLVECTGFGLWGNKSSDGELILGRNFDFFVGKKFAEKKIVAFYKPDNGHQFMFITWGGLTGVVSGMNDAGLTITLNSAKSSIPTTAYTPVSIVARNILQHCATIDEAYAEAKKFKTFVSESFLIGSGQENRAAVIEKSPEKIALYQSGRTDLIVTNHYQSKTFATDKLNMEDIAESASMYRMKRMEELVGEKDSMNYLDVAKILRNQKGLHGKGIGLCNEKAVNQLIAHHSIIFRPKKMQVWVSTQPFQLGEYICYDLNKVFADSANYKTVIHIDSLTIPVDSFLYSQAFKNSQLYRAGVEKMHQAIRQHKTLNEDYLKQFIDYNPKFFYVYKLVGDYYAEMGQTKKAIRTYNKAFACEFPRVIDRKDIEVRIKKLEDE